MEGGEREKKRKREKTNVESKNRSNYLGKKQKGLEICEELRRRWVRAWMWREREKGM